MTRDGYSLLRGLLTGRQIKRLREAVSALGATRAVDACERPNNTLVPLRWNDTAVVTALNDEVLLRRVRAATGGSDLRWISGYVSIKEPRSGPLCWHQDWWCWSHAVTRQTQAPQVALLCYLNDTTASSGALRVLAGSHLESHAIHAVLRNAPGVSSYLSEPDHPAFADQPGQVTLEVRAGDAVLLDYRVLHSTHPNTTNRSRDCLILSFVPSWSCLPDDVRAHLIGGLALPTDAERASAQAMLGHLLPDYCGTQRDLALVRDAPSRFQHRSSRR